MTHCADPDHEGPARELERAAIVARSSRCNACQLRAIRLVLTRRLTAARLSRPVRPADVPADLAGPCAHPNHHGHTLHRRYGEQGHPWCPTCRASP